MPSTEIATANTTAVAPGGGGALSLSPQQTAWTPEQLAVVKQLGLEGASEGELKLFLHVCQQTGLDPFAKQIYGIMRNQYNSQTRRSEPKLTIQTGIDGFRLVASRRDRNTGAPSQYEGRVGPLWCGRDGIWTDVWTEPGHPYAAKVGVYKTGFRDALWAICHYTEYVQTKADGTPVPMWERMPANQLAKCAEAAALRGAFPQDLSGVYAPEEMGHVAAQSLANRTVDAAPMRSDEEQEQWDAMAAAEKALDAEALGALYKAAAKVKNDALVAAISAAGFRVKRALVEKAEREAEAGPAVSEVVDAEVVPDQVPAAAQEPVQQAPEPAPAVQQEPVSTAADVNLITRSGVAGLSTLFGKIGAETPDKKRRFIKEHLGIDIESLTVLTVGQANLVIEAINKVADSRKRTAEEPEDVPFPTDEPE
jgi:phage recombination protein Bet